jgi:protein-arginine kinase activator protein McsA
VLIRSVNPSNRTELTSSTVDVTIDKRNPFVEQNILFQVIGIIIIIFLIVILIFRHKKQKMDKKLRTHQETYHCPHCNDKIDYIPQTQKYYCQSCKKYPFYDKKQKGTKSKPGTVKGRSKKDKSKKEQDMEDLEQELLDMGLDNVLK